MANINPPPETKFFNSIRYRQFQFGYFVESKDFSLILLLSFWISDIPACTSVIGIKTYRYWPVKSSMV